MTKKEILAELQQWQTVQKDLDKQLDLLYDLVGCQPESPLLEAIYAVAGAHTKAVGDMVGDKSTWLEWWQFECRFGEKYLGTVEISGKPRNIRTLKQLARIIAE